MIAAASAGLLNLSTLDLKLKKTQQLVKLACEYVANINRQHALQWLGNLQNTLLIAGPVEHYESNRSKAAALCNSWIEQAMPWLVITEQDEVSQISEWKCQYEKRFGKIDSPEFQAEQQRLIDYWKSCG